MLQWVTNYAERNAVMTVFIHIDTAKDLALVEFDVVLRERLKFDGIREVEIEEGEPRVIDPETVLVGVALSVTLIERGADAVAAVRRLISELRKLAQEVRGVEGVLVDIDGEERALAEVDDAAIELMAASVD
jgi:broad specificity phosphatase PhoE